MITDHPLYNNFTLPELKNKTMIIKVVREVFTDTVTIGKIFIDGAYFAHTLEDKYRGQHGNKSIKVQGQTCIDAGNYKVVLSQSARFKRILPELLNVPCFDKIRIHGGNTEANTDGCILIGSETDGHSRIWNCADKVNELIERMNGKDVSIVIEGEPVAV